MATVNRPTLAGLQAMVEALRHNLDLAMTERDSARTQLVDRDAENVALRAKVDVLNAQLDAATAKAHEYEVVLTNVNVAEMIARMRPSKPIDVQISDRRAAMQRAREEAMRSGRSAKVKW